MAKKGKPRITIDWTLVDNLLISGSSGIQAAAYIGIHADTLYNRCVIEKGMTFADYSAKMKAKGDSMIHASQFEVATKTKNPSMLIWLGKNRLDQKENKEPQAPPNDKAISELIDTLKTMHKEKIPTDES